MNVLIGYDQAHDWFKKVVDAKLTIQKDTAENREDFRKYFLARKNFWRRLIPFMRELPADTKVDFDAQDKFNSHHHWIDSCNASNLSDLNRIEDDIIRLMRQGIDGVILSERECRLIDGARYH